MKRFFLLLLLSAALIGKVEPSYAFITPVLSIPMEPTVTPKPSPFAGMTVKQFLALTPKEYQKLTGKKLSLSQKISLKLAQAKVKKMSKQNKQIDLYKMDSGIDSSDFSIGGFVLGLLLGPIGVLIAYLIGDRSVIKWSWIGGAIWLAIVLLVAIL
ncbi:MAG TPA: hypothetical protein VLC28_07075 [Flavitalea sp.]|nr:hypothetical protein [Flavitalea sp.]